MQVCNCTAVCVCVPQGCARVCECALQAACKELRASTCALFRGLRVHRHVCESRCVCV